MGHGPLLCRAPEKPPALAQARLPADGRTLAELLDELRSTTAMSSKAVLAVLRRLGQWVTR